jgi:isoleucyl-tRNA synthetase
MFNFPEIEEKILKNWREKDIFNKTLAKASPKGSFVFYEGPPTANGKPGIHHVLARAFKDLIPRFKTMQGYLVERKAGWDTHGLPVELEVEKKLKISGKPDIEKYGIAKFNEQCQASVWQYKEEWEKLTQRIAFWLDLEHPYVTYHKDYVESLWWIFKEVHRSGYLYQGHKVVPQCPRCGTALSSHEVAQGYKEVREPSIYVKFKITTGNQYIKEGDCILSWTTTPWTLPGNVALAVGENFDYVKIQISNSKSQEPDNHQNPKSKIQNLVLAKELLKIIEEEYKILSEFKGKDLVGVEYEPLFPGAIPSEVENYQNAFKVYPADFVTTQDGTGIVHTAVMYGEDDYRLGSQVGLPKFHTVDENGNFNNSVNKWAGKFVKDKEVETGIINDLKERGLFFNQVDYTHDYPFCWRCDTPLLYYAKDSWFFAMSRLQKDLLKENQKINWVPEHIKEGRFGEWLVSVKDWAISRERYWGTPLPIWKCEKCEEIKVIGSYKELFDETGCPLVEKDDFDPHRPFIDEYKLKCDCGGEMWRVPEVADCWFDSGSMPLAQYHYPFENKKKVDAKDYYPADFIAEAIDQTRGWFYTLLAIGVLLGKGTPYKNVICLGHINDTHGHKMSKSKGNIVDPWEVINKWGADALRFHLYTVNAPGDSKNFDIKNVETVVKKNFMILFNVLSFYQTYERSKTEDQRPKTNNVLDEWILARLNQLIVKVTDNLEKYNIFSAGRLITEFIDDLSTWYLRRSRDRFKSENKDDKLAAVETLGFVLLNLSKIMAPFTPFIAEELYQKLGGKLESVHLEEWPEYEFDYEEDKKLGIKNKEVIVLSDMETVRKIVESALAARDEAGIKVRQPLAKLEIPEYELSAELLQLIKDEVNIKKVEFNKKLAVGQVKLDSSLTDELKAEGLFRELIRSVNQLRKEAKLTINDQVTIDYQTDSETVEKVIGQFKEELFKNTISHELNNQKAGDYLIEKELKVNGEELWLGLKKKE